MKTSKQNIVYLSVVGFLKLNKNPAWIARKLGKSKQQIQAVLSRLKLEGKITKLGYGTWQYAETKQVNNELGKAPLELVYKGAFMGTMQRGHNFVFSVLLPQLKRWRERRLFFEKRGISFKSHLKKHNVETINFGGYKCWLSDKRVMIILSQKSFFGLSAMETVQKAKSEVLGVLRVLENLLGCRLRFADGYHVRLGKNTHIGNVFNPLAKDFLRNKQKLRVFDDSGGLWLLVDDSPPGWQELEAVGVEAQKDMDEVVAPFWNSVKRHKGVTIDRLLDVDASFRESLARQMLVLKFLEKRLSDLERRI
jgi:hypothetical protein